jgi:hypothetical protein
MLTRCLEKGQIVATCQKCNRLFITKPDRLFCDWCNGERDRRKEVDKRYYRKHYENWKARKNKLKGLQDETEQKA